MRPPLTFLVLAAVLFAGGPLTRGAEVQGLYEAQVDVTSQTPDERMRALRSALAQVLVKASGLRAVAENPALAGAFKEPSRYVQQYRYRTLPPQPGAEPSKETSQDVLWARFDEAAINALLVQAGLPAWGKARPLVLAWVAVEDGGKRDLLTSDADNPLASAMQRQAAARGVPLVLPLYDLEDQAHVRVSDVWGEFTDTLRDASRRYGSDAVLAARAYKVAGAWEVRWALVLGDQPERWVSDDDRLDLALDEGVDQAVDRLAERFARTAPGGENEDLDLIVTDIRSVDDYARALRYLKSVDRVNAVDVIRMEPGQATFRLRTRADKGTISQSIALGSTLGAVAAGDTWTYQLLP